MKRERSILEIEVEHHGYKAGRDAAIRTFATPQTDTKLLSKEVLELADKYPELLTLPREKYVQFASKEIRKLRAQCDALKEQRKRMIADKSDFDEILAWADAGPKLETPAGVLFRRLRKAARASEVLYVSGKGATEFPSEEYEYEVFKNAEILVVEHDWSAAFKNSDIEDDGAIHLPFDVCAFEFRFSGRGVIALATELDTKLMFSLVIEAACGRFVMVACPVGWGATSWSGTEETRKRGLDGFGDLVNQIARQIKCICIALDAEVAHSQVVREPHSSQHGKNVHSLPKPYHVVSLTRHSARPLPIAAEATGRRVRLHFRRGHWRHFPTFKTWIKWTLVGDPDLGFIDKHYRL